MRAPFTLKTLRLRARSTNLMPEDPDPLEPWLILEQEWVLFPLEPKN